MTLTRWFRTRSDGSKHTPPCGGRSVRRRRRGSWIIGGTVLACVAGATAQEEPVTRVSVEVAGEQEESQSAEPVTEALDVDRVLRQIIPPHRIDEYGEPDVRDGDKPDPAYYERLLNRIAHVRRPVQVRLTIEEVLERVLRHNFALDVARYNPAIEATRLVEAEALFDASLYSNISKLIQDRPSGSQLSATDFDRFSWETGVRKLLPGGMRVNTSYSLERQSTSLAFQQLNPQYFSQLNLGFQQPLLRGFGIDYNRSAIVVASHGQRIADHQYREQVRDVVRQVEATFWRLVQARGEVVISARLLEKFESIYDFLEKRKDFDVNKIQLEDTKANLETTRAEFLRILSAVRNAEDALIALMNDPELNLGNEIEIIPDGIPVYPRIVVDRIGELQTALESRTEIKSAQLAVMNAAIGIGQARNELLPRLDLTFNYAVDGLGKSADRSFDEVTKHDFTEYSIGVEFEIPIGNRAAKARHQRARLTLAQAEAELKRRTEQIITEVNVAVRNLETNWAVILPRLESVEAGVRQVEAIDARAERKDYAQLNAELGAHNGLAAGRRQLLQALVDYYLSVIDLERAKGTLLEYNNIVLVPVENEGP